MEITLAGLVIVPVLIAIFFMRRRWLVPAIVVLAPLPSVSVLNVSVISFGLQASAAAGILLIASLAPSALRRGKWMIDAGGMRHLAPLFVFAGWAFASGQLMPRVFAGELVRNADGDIVPLASSLLHVTQFGYLLFGVLLAAAVVMSLRNPRAQRAVLWAFVASGWIAFLLGLVQLREATSPTFLSDILFNNPGFALLTGQSIDGEVRMSSTLIEPSVASVFFGGYSGAIAMMLVDTKADRRRVVVLSASLTVGLVSLFLTRATTGFIAAGAIALILAWHLGRTRRSVHRFAISLIGITILVVSVTTALRTGLIAKDSGFVGAVFSMTTEKSGTESAEERLAGETLAWSGFRHSMGIGLGWGSSRAYSLGSTILANTGVIGAGLVLWFIATIARLGRSADNTTGHRPLRRPMQGFTMVAFAAATFSAPDVTFTFFWVPIGAWVASMLPYVTTRSAAATVQPPQRASGQQTSAARSSRSIQPATARPNSA